MSTMPTTRILLRNLCRLVAGAAVIVGSFVVAPAAYATASCNNLTATIEGTSGSDTLTGTNGADVIAGRRRRHHLRWCGCRHHHRR